MMWEPDVTQCPQMIQRNTNTASLNNRFAQKIVRVKFSILRKQRRSQESKVNCVFLDFSQELHSLRYLFTPITLTSDTNHQLRFLYSEGSLMK